MPFRRAYRSSRRASRRGGFLLGIVIIVLLVVTVLGFGYLAIAVHEFALAVRERDNAAAFFLAEAGRQRALYRLSTSLDWSALPSELYTDESLGDGTYSVRLTNKSTDAATIISTGQVGRMRRTVVQDVQRK